MTRLLTPRAALELRELASTARDKGKSKYGTASLAVSVRGRSDSPDTRPPDRTAQGAFAIGQHWIL